MITVVVPTLNAEATLGDALTALIPAVVEGLVREVIIVDGGSTDRTLKIADASGATIIECDTGRGAQLAAGARAARGSWLLFLHADTVLEPGWTREAAHVVERVDGGAWEPTAAVFRFCLDDRGLLPRIVELGVAARSGLLKLPYGDQGLLLPRRLYDEVGGFSAQPLMEDVAMARRLGRRRIVTLRTAAVTSAVRYKRDGYAGRIARNWACLTLYSLGASPAWLKRVYG